MKKLTIVKVKNKNSIKSRMKILLFCLICTVSAKATDFKIYYSSGNNGSLDFCGCVHDRNSGIVGRVSKLLKIKDLDGIYIEAGNFFAANQDTSDLNVTMQIMNKYLPDIVCPGYQDLDHINIFKKNKIPVLGYNIEDCLSHKVIYKNGVSLGFIGAVDESYSVRYGSIVNHFDYKKLKQDISSLKSQCDLLFFISSLNDQQEGQLFGECKDIDFLISINKYEKTDDKFGNRYLTALGRIKALLGEISINQQTLKISGHRFVSVDVDSVEIDENLQKIIDAHKLRKLKK